MTRDHRLPGLLVAVPRSPLVAVPCGPLVRMFAACRDARLQVVDLGKPMRDATCETLP